MKLKRRSPIRSVRRGGGEGGNDNEFLTTQFPGKGGSDISKHDEEKELIDWIQKTKYAPNSLQKIRIERKLTIKQVEKAVGLPHDSLEGIETGKHISAHAIYKLAEYYGLELKPLLIEYGVIIPKATTPPSGHDLNEAAKEYAEKIVPVVSLKGDRLITTREDVREDVYDAFLSGASFQKEQAVELWLTDIIRSNGSETNISKSARILKDYLFTSKKDKE